MIDQEGGKLGGSKVGSVFCKGRPAAKQIIASAGGIKKFCAQHTELEFVTEVAGDGFVKRRSRQKSAQDGCAEPCRLPTHDETIVNLNSQGLPSRPGHRPCKYYMMTWRCSYGAKCIWDHPEAEVSVPTPEATIEEHQN